MSSKKWFIGWLLIVIMGLGALAGWVYAVDPYMHYHKPDTEHYFYKLNNQRSQNDGITKYFEYDALITGTSMAENFKSSEMDALFECNSIKVCYSGGSFREINDNLKIAVDSNPNLKYVVRSLDLTMFFHDKDRFRTDLGKYPTYLYDSNPFNDVEYVWNRDVIWNTVYPMTENRIEGSSGGITGFDDYSCWQKAFTFGIDTVCPDGISQVRQGEPVHITDREKSTIKANIEQNVTSLALDNPDITFYCFFTPYSIAYWKNKVSAGTIYKQIEAEEYIIELLLQCENIQLFSFSNRLDITCDLNHYKDEYHYGQWVNSLILKWMHDGQYRLTQENYKAYIAEELSNYLSFDYQSINEKIDYESDFYAAALLNRELTGTEPVNLLEEYEEDFVLNNAKITECTDGATGIECTGRLPRESGSTVTVLDYVTQNEYVGAEIEISNIDDYGYLTFYGKKVQDHGQPTVFVLSDTGELIGKAEANYRKIDNEWHQYVIDITKAKGSVKVFFNGGYIDQTGSVDSDYIFSNIVLY